MKNEGFVELVEKEFTEKVIKVAHTTSKKCDRIENSKLFDDETNEYRKLRINFDERTTTN